jgi:glycosyltransferase involved in cell wall biosynthesis
MDGKISVIIPTTCEASRASLIRRSLTSVVSQVGVDLDVIVVVNGNRFDPDLLAELQANKTLRIRQRAEGNVSLARIDGLASSTGSFFCFLDDDDEYLPGALRKRVGLFVDGDDVVVTNGYRHDGQDTPLVPAEIAREANTDPAGSFLRCNWFASPAAIFRAATVERSLFDITLRYFEWTYLFFALLGAGKIIRYHDRLTYRKYEDNPQSVSKSVDYARAYPAFLRGLMGLDLDARIKRLLRAKYVVALNGLSVMELNSGRLGMAWAAHARCLSSGGWKYLPYTHHLLRRG